MTDETAKAATPHAQLIDEIMDSRIPKTEREHAARREIEMLRSAAAAPCCDPIDVDLHTAWQGTMLDLAREYRIADDGAEVRDAWRALREHIGVVPASLDLTIPELRAGIALQLKEIERLRAIPKRCAGIEGEEVGAPCNLYRDMEWQVSELRKQVEELRAELASERLVASVAVNDLEATIKWVREHAGHDDRCNVIGYDDEGKHLPCSCGFTAAAGYDEALREMGE